MGKQILTAGTESDAKQAALFKCLRGIKRSILQIEDMLLV